MPIEHVESPRLPTRPKTGEIVVVSTRTPPRLRPMVYTATVEMRRIVDNRAVCGGLYTPYDMTYNMTYNTPYNMTYNTPFNMTYNMTYSMTYDMTYNRSYNMTYDMTLIYMNFEMKKFTEMKHCNYTEPRIS